jgi:HEAT repeat protein
MSAARDESDREERLRRIFAAKEDGDTDYLIASLRDPDYRHMAAKFLAELAERKSFPEAIPALLRLLDANDPHTRSSAALALGRLRAEEAAPRLVGVAQQDPIAWVRAWAVGALGDLRDQRTVPVIITLLQDPDWRVRRSAAVVLGELGDERAIHPLERGLAAERWIGRRPYRKALRQLKSRVH